MTSGVRGVSSVLTNKPINGPRKPNGAAEKIPFYVMLDLIAGIDEPAAFKFLLTRIYRYTNTKRGCAWAAQKKLAWELGVPLSVIERFFRKATSKSIVEVKTIKIERNKSYAEYKLTLSSLLRLQRPKPRAEGTTRHETSSEIFTHINDKGEDLDLNARRDCGGESSAALKAYKRDDDSPYIELLGRERSKTRLGPDWNAIETEIDKYKLKAKSILLNKGFPAHFVDAAVQYIEERSDYSGSIPSSPEYFLVAFNRVLAEPRDKATIVKRAELRARIMPSETELFVAARDLLRQSHASGKTIRELLEARAAALATPMTSQRAETIPPGKEKAESGATMRAPLRTP
jgi:hypothetical protein